MTHKGAIEALDRTRTDICGNAFLMVGYSFLMGADFRQTLPVIPRGSRVEIRGN